jgi:hypothetical protein
LYGVNVIVEQQQNVAARFVRRSIVYCSIVERTWVVEDLHSRISQEAPEETSSLCFPALVINDE